MTPALLDDLVREATERAPDAVALVDGERVATYAELWERAGRLARLLQGAGCLPGDRVALLQPKSLEAVIGILGALRAGCVYVPLDPGGPAPRLARILAACEPRILLVSGSAVKRGGEILGELPAGTRPLVARVDPATLGAVGDASTEEVAAPLLFAGADLDRTWRRSRLTREEAEDAAHLLSSGSTGAPKGVAVPHRSVRRFIAWANPYFGVTPADRHSGHSPLFFDLSTYDLFGTLAAGAQLHLVPVEANLLPHRLAAFIRDRALTQWFSVPSVLTHLAGVDAVRPGDFPALRRLLWCGEVLPTAALIHWMARLPHVPSRTCWPTDRPSPAAPWVAIPDDPRTPTPIGRACAGRERSSGGDDLRPCPAGVEGPAIHGESDAGVLADGDRRAVQDSPKMGPPHRTTPVGMAADLCRKGRGADQAAASPHRLREIRAARLRPSGGAGGGAGSLASGGSRDEDRLCVDAPDAAGAWPPRHSARAQLALPGICSPASGGSADLRAPETASWIGARQRDSRSGLVSRTSRDAGDRRVFREDLHLDVSSPRSTWSGVGLLDSMALIDLVHRLEQVLDDASISDAGLDDWRSVRRIVSAQADGRGGAARMTGLASRRGILGVSVPGSSSPCRTDRQLPCGCGTGGRDPKQPQHLDAGSRRAETQMGADGPGLVSSIPSSRRSRPGAERSVSIHASGARRAGGRMHPIQCSTAHRSGIGSVGARAVLAVVGEPGDARGRIHLAGAVPDQA
jgi:hypothetical protein